MCIRDSPTTQHAAAIHVYRGNFLAMPRREWTGTPYTERPYDSDRRAAEFEAANERPPESR